MSICQMGGLEPKTYPSRPSETQVWFLKNALSGWRNSESRYTPKHRFWPKKALFCTVMAAVLQLVKIVIFVSKKL